MSTNQRIVKCIKWVKRLSKTVLMLKELTIRPNYRRFSSKFSKSSRKASYEYVPKRGFQLVLTLESLTTCTTCSVFVTNVQTHASYHQNLIYFCFVCFLVFVLLCSCNCFFFSFWFSVFIYFFVLKKIF